MLRDGAEAWFDEGQDSQAEWRMGLYGPAQLEDGSEGILVPLNSLSLHWEAKDVFEATAPLLRMLKP